MLSANKFQSSLTRMRIESARLMSIAVFLTSLPIGAVSGDSTDAPFIPHVDSRAHEGYREFLNAPRHRAFAIAPGGAWSWSDGHASEQAAEEAALAACKEYTDQHCVIYALNARVVFDSVIWHTLWRPYLDANQARGASTGVRKGQRFWDIEFRDKNGWPGSLSAFRGKVVLLHFWGTWCTYCLPELSELQLLHDELGADEDFSFVLLQVRESYATTRQWLDEHRFNLPQYDSGVHSAGDTELHLSDGSTVKDRDVARAFPTTYILDRNGIVVFRRTGPALRWKEYAPFMRDIAKHQSG